MSSNIAAAQNLEPRPTVLRAPWVGLLAFALIWLWKPIAHTIAVLMYEIHDPLVLAAVNLGMGGVGFVLVWRGLSKTELPATWFGFLGGALIWIGWFEFSFATFARTIGVDPIRDAEGRIGLPANFALMQATGFIVLALFLFFAANKDTGCRFFQWLHRNLGLKPGSGTPGYRRQHARIAALELVMTNWFCYIVILLIYDPRIAGPSHPLAYTAAAVIAALSIYLIGFKLREQRTVAPALRYSIGAVAVFWLLCEMTARWGWYREVWLQPFNYPVSCLTIVSAFVFGIVYTLKFGQPVEENP